MEWRLEQLKAIPTMVDESRDAMYEALWHDLRRNRVDADLMDVDFNVREASYALDHLRDWLKIEKVPTPVVMQPAHVRVRREPLGVTLIIGAWNEPYRPAARQAEAIDTSTGHIGFRCIVRQGNLEKEALAMVARD